MCHLLLLLLLLLPLILPLYHSLSPPPASPPPSPVPIYCRYVQEDVLQPTDVHYRHFHKIFEAFRLTEKEAPPTATPTARPIEQTPTTIAAKSAAAQKKQREEEEEEEEEEVREGRREGGGGGVVVMWGERERESHSNYSAGHQESRKCICFTKCTFSQ